jgi:uncharacterized protein
MIKAPKTDRLLSIDALRGFAVLGILMMNVQSFSMLPTAYEDPTTHMDLTGINLTVWAWANTFFNMKFITIFSALFGAGIVLMVGDDTSLDRHFKRMRWLLAIGLIHAYLFWFGDILVAYAVFGMLAVRARQWSTAKLMIAGLVLIAIAGAVILAAQYPWSAPADTAEQDAFFATWDQNARAGFLSHIPFNAIIAFFSEIMTLTVYGGRILGVMLIGMALFKNGFFSATWSAWRYAIIAAVALSIGLGSAHIGTHIVIESAFAPHENWQMNVFNYFGSLIAALGYSALIMFLSKIRAFALLLKVFAATGRMALTNYLAQTLLMTFIFIGSPGLGLLGSMERIDQAKLVMLVWALQLIWSPIWLGYFRFGPFEWLWRSLTYGARQPMLKSTLPPTPRL